jgi:geranylgeranyl diphosphate synthase type II
VDAIPVRESDATNAAPSDPLPIIERYMGEFVDSLGMPANLSAAVRYALLGPGKRLRPLLVAHSCAAVGGSLEACLPAATAVEMIHSFSLVHDDLPALDNDDLRRGRPTVHVAHGEAMAILAGDGLMSLAFQVLAERCDDIGLAGTLTGELARGTTHMIEGQVLDTLGGVGAEVSPAKAVEIIHKNKTGALIRASCRMGAISGLWKRGVNTAELGAITRYAESIGLMFQIVDDLMDVEQSADHTGKRTNKDVDAGKLTYPSTHGVEASRREIQRLAEVALTAIGPLGANAAALRETCQYLSTRTR